MVERGSALPLVRQLLDDNLPDEAAATAQLALHMDDCQDREALEAALLETASTPEGWLPVLEDFAKAPSEGCQREGHCVHNCDTMLL